MVQSTCVAAVCCAIACALICVTADCLWREKKAAKIAYSKYIASQGIDGSANFTDYPQHDEAITAAYTDETSGKEPLVDVNASTHETLIE